MSTAAAFPSWSILEPFVFRRDDAASFPDETKAPVVRASGTTSWGAPFRVAFSFAEPPRVSRLYAQLPGFPGPDKETPLGILATHHHLALLRVSTELPDFVTVQDLFIFSACHDDPSSLQRLPPCSEPYMDAQPPRVLPYPKDHRGVERRLLSERSMGLLCRGEGEHEFAVAELKLSKRRNKLHADIFFLKSAAGEKWRSVRVPILHTGNPDEDDVRDLLFWQTDDVIPVDRWLCWVDYSRGMLFCDVFGEPKPTVFFLRFPLNKVPDSYNRSITCSRMYRGVSAIDADAGRALKFVHVARSDDTGRARSWDDFGYQALKPGASFTITCYTLSLGGGMAGMRWIKDSTATSDELWPASGSPDEFPHEIVMFPQVNSDRPHVVYFLISSYEYVIKKMWVVSIDMNTKTVESFSRYINGKEDLGTVDADLTRTRSTCPLPFLPCELSKYLHDYSSRKKNTFSHESASASGGHHDDSS